MAAETRQNRFCPLCAQITTKSRCPADGIHTIQARPASVNIGGLSVGDLVGARYRITGVLGRGANGTVYAALDVDMGRPVAIKVMLSDPEGVSEEAIRRFQKEARLTARLRHPNTVRVFDVGQSADGLLYIGMELLRGPTLERLLRRLGRRGRVLTEEQSLEIAVAILGGLAEAHAQGLVHRDLKPGNVILSAVEGDGPVVKILDFGCARTVGSSLTGEGRTLGTPPYMSPEQCSAGRIDGRSDLYSLGIILYRCVAGRVPFDDPNPMTLMYQHNHVEPPPLAGAAATPISERFDALVHRALAKRASDRFADARGMRESVLDCLAHHTAGGRVPAGHRVVGARTPGVAAALIDEHAQPGGLAELKEAQETGNTSGAPAVATRSGARGRWWRTAAVSALCTSVLGLGVVHLVSKSDEAGAQAVEKAASASPAQAAVVAPELPMPTATPAAAPDAAASAQRADTRSGASAPEAATDAASTEGRAPAEAAAQRQSKSKARTARRARRRASVRGARERAKRRARTATDAPAQAVENEPVTPPPSVTTAPAASPKPAPARVERQPRPGDRLTGKKPARVPGIDTDDPYGDGDKPAAPASGNKRVPDLETKDPWR